ncbi:uncharacterized protein LOC141526029 [Cotesia typhae]|uniref:uncharacterized protein LOC141526029 n=2 Tax=Cotesia typhae TaxID=2053667 RepID=UPI003D6811E4
MTSRTPRNALRPDISLTYQSLDRLSTNNVSLIKVIIKLEFNPLLMINMTRAIVEFIQYLREWEQKSIEEKEKYKYLKKHLDEDQLPGKFDFAITSSTLSGLKISLGATLELVEFLHTECNYDYLMTIRLTQDALEKFFGIMRSACGCNDHPDVMLFGQVYRLLCSYSLATPPKGSNVTAGELLQSLMQTKDSLALASTPKNEWLKKLDDIVEEGICDISEERSDNGTGEDENVSKNHLEDDSMFTGQVYVDRRPFESLVDTTDDDDEDQTDQIHEVHSRKPFESLVDDSDDEDNNINNNNNNDNKDEYEYHPDQEYTVAFQDPHHDHDYDVVKSSDEIVAYIAGYMVRKTSRYTKCFTCIETLQSANKAASGRDKFIELMSDGGLIFPSENLFLLIKSLEEDVLTIVGTKTIKCNTMHQILDRISLRKSLPTLGCPDHSKQLIMKIINYFIAMRGNFLAKLFNKNLNQRKLLTRKYRKTAKLM